MDRAIASKFARQKLDEYGLSDWGVRLANDSKNSYMGLCSYKDKCIFINYHHVDIHPDGDVRDTILHEIAHALCPGQGHNDIWAAKAREIGCTNTLPCYHNSLPAHVIDGIRSGATIEMTVEEETHVIRKPIYKVTRLQDKCPECGKVAIEKFAVNTVDKEGNQIKLITLECFHIIKKIVPKATPFELMVSNDWKPEVKSCKHDWNKNQCKECGEYKLFNFQVIGARAAEAALAVQKGFGIFDDMGLGKTVQGLAIPKYHQEYDPFMVVTKSAITYQWFKQIVRWLGPNYLPQIIRTGRDYLMPGLKCYIISYDLLRRMPREKLHKLGIKLIILDEVQQIKNADSARTQEVRKLVSANPLTKVIELSGTPWKNRGGEFFPALNLMDPIKFHSEQYYLDTWVAYYYQGNQRKMGGIRNPEKFRQYTENLLIRREYNEVMDEFPDINRMKLPVQLDALSQSQYDETVSDFVAWYNQAIIDGVEESLSGIELLAKMAKMRHLVGLSKIPATIGFIEEFVEDTDRKMVVFVHHKDVGQLMYNSLTDTNADSNPDWFELANDLVKQGIRVLKYTSELSDSERFEMQELFNKSSRSIMVASTLACGEGVDLQTCSDSILHERQWNPQNEEQATPGRFRRIGQLSSVINITVPEGEGTIDMELDAIIERKRRQFHDVMNKSEMPVWNESDLGRELAENIVAKWNKRNKNVVKTKPVVSMASK